MLKELFSLLLARELGLTAPEPVLVELLEGFDWGVADFPDHAELIRQSLGWNVGTIHLGDDWKPWIQGSAPRSIPHEKLETAYAFDAVVQNSDRMPDNPNLLWRGEELALLDFDKAFGFLRMGEKDEKPWRNALDRQTLALHCLHGHLPAIGGEEVLGGDLWDAFEEWWLEKPSCSLSAEIAAATDDFFRFLSDVSRHS